jgi:hypothetical protein
MAQTTQQFKNYDVSSYRDFILSEYDQKNIRKVHKRNLKSLSMKESSNYVLKTVKGQL